MTNAELAGQRVLITRPQSQAENLANLIQQHGGQPIVFPVMQIEPLPLESWQDTPYQNADWLIFVSRHAVQYFVAGFKQPLSSQMKLAVVGSGTAQALRLAGFRVDCEPDNGEGSEALLLMPSMLEMKNKKVVIVRGNGGREMLANRLTNLGALTQYVEVYQRLKINPSETLIAQAKTADRLVCTSQLGIDNLCHIFVSELRVLLSKPLVVVSSRIEAYAKEKGFCKVFVADGSNDNAVLQCLNNME